MEEPENKGVELSSWVSEDTDRADGGEKAYPLRAMNEIKNAAIKIAGFLENHLVIFFVLGIIVILAAAHMALFSLSGAYKSLTYNNMGRAIKTVSRAKAEEMFFRSLDSRYNETALRELYELSAESGDVLAAIGYLRELNKKHGGKYAAMLNDYRPDAPEISVEGGGHSMLTVSIANKYPRGVKVAMNINGEDVSYNGKGIVISEAGEYTIHASASRFGLVSEAETSAVIRSFGCAVLPDIPEGEYPREFELSVSEQSGNRLLYKLDGDKDYKELSGTIHIGAGRTVLSFIAANENGLRSTPSELVYNVRKVKSGNAAMGSVVDSDGRYIYEVSHGVITVTDISMGTSKKLPLKPEPKQVYCYDGSLYYTDADGTMFDPDGNPLPIRGAAMAVFLNDTVYYYDKAANTVNSYSLTTNERRTLGNYSITDIAADRNSVYWLSSSGSVYKNGTEIMIGATHMCVTESYIAVEKNRSVILADKNGETIGKLGNITGMGSKVESGTYYTNPEGASIYYTLGPSYGDIACITIEWVPEFGGASMTWAVLIDLNTRKTINPSVPMNFKGVSDSGLVY